jgi:hypothetical protein
MEQPEDLLCQPPARPERRAFDSSGATRQGAGLMLVFTVRALSESRRRNHIFLLGYSIKCIRLPKYVASYFA